MELEWKIDGSLKDSRLHYYPLEDVVRIPFMMSEKYIVLPLFIASFSHEFLHWWLFRNIGWVACSQFDVIDKNDERRGYLISSG